MRIERHQHILRLIPKNQREESFLHEFFENDMTIHNTPY